MVDPMQQLQDLERENAMLRSGIAALLEHVKSEASEPCKETAIGPPPGLAPPPQTTPAEVPMQASATEQEASPPLAPEASPEPATATSGGATPEEGLDKQAQGEGEPEQIRITLRRADGVPLGLGVRGDKGEPCLIVEQVNPGGAVDSWNRMCKGGPNEICIGDHILEVNGLREAKAMRKECVNKLLLKLLVTRAPSATGEAGADGAVPATSTLSPGAAVFEPLVLAPAPPEAVATA
jgi:hypothetical protein